MPVATGNLNGGFPATPSLGTDCKSESEADDKVSQVSDARRDAALVVQPPSAVTSFALNEGMPDFLQWVLEEFSVID